MHVCTRSSRQRLSVSRLSYVSWGDLRPSFQAQSRCKIHKHGFCRRRLHFSVFLKSAETMPRFVVGPFCLRLFCVVSDFNTVEAWACSSEPADFFLLFFLEMLNFNLGQYDQPLTFTKLCWHAYLYKVVQLFFSASKTHRWLSEFMGKYVERYLMHSTPKQCRIGNTKTQELIG